MPTPCTPTPSLGSFLPLTSPSSSIAPLLPLSAGSLSPPQSREPAAQRQASRAAMLPGSVTRSVPPVPLTMVPPPPIGPRVPSAPVVRTLPWILPPSTPPWYRCPPSPSTCLSPDPRPPPKPPPHFYILNFVVIKTRGCAFSRGA